METSIIKRPADHKLLTVIPNQVQSEINAKVRKNSKLFKRVENSLAKVMAKNESLID